jgi:hypothetical protein
MSTLAKFLVAVALVATVGPVVAAPVPKGANDNDPLPVDCVWAGKLTQNGGGPTEFECEFKITKRDGEKFEAELHAKTGELELTYLVRGTLEWVDLKRKEKGYKIAFKSYEAKDVKNAGAIIGVSYTATLENKKIKGMWKVPDDSPFNNLTGDFEFEPAKKKD